MNETASPARANREGDLCPRWCAVDHDAGGGYFYLFHGGETAWVEVPGKMRDYADVIHVRAIRGGYPGDAPQVDVSATRHGTADPHAWIAPREAEPLAVIVEMLAKATPAQHRALAAAIRQAAAQITEARDG
jgi:hypothetical protein